MAVEIVDLPINNSMVTFQSLPILDTLQKFNY
jgi:hypothetical protein